jgi:hypothetical protein
MDIKLVTALAPVLQTLLWCLLIGGALLLLKDHLLSLLAALERRVRQGSGIKLGDYFELSETELVTQTSDLKEGVEVFGNPDRLQLLFKARGRTWVNSTKAMEVAGGCLVEVTNEHQRPDGSWTSAEALAFVPGVIVVPEPHGAGRMLVPKEVAEGGVANS